MTYAAGVDAPTIPTADAAGTTIAPSRGLGRSASVAVLATVWPIIGSVVVVSVAPFVAPWLRTQGPAGVGYFVVALAALGAIAFAPTYTTAALAGWTFGFAAGFPAMLVATLVGSVLCYGLADRLAGGRVATTFAQNPKWEVVRRALAEASRLKTLWLVTLLRLSPVLPFGTTNVLLATTRVPLAVYVGGTLLGLAPRIALVTLAAAGTERMDLSAADSWPLLGLGIAATAACIAALALAGKRALDRATRQADGVEGSATA